MVLASPGPLLTPPPSSSPPKTPFRSYSAITPPRYGNPILPLIGTAVINKHLASSFSTGPPGYRGALHCHWRAIATQPIGLVPFQARCILPVVEEQSRTRGGQSGVVTDQPQCRGLWHSGRHGARFFTRSPPSPPPSFTLSPFPPCSSTSA